MSNALLDPKIYANVGLKLLKNNLVMARLVNGEYLLSGRAPEISFEAERRALAT